MELIVDLHIHSHYSRATSKDSTVEGLYKWGKIKGITVIGTGDFTHPLWIKELREKLEPAERGLFRLREDISQKIDKELPESVRSEPIRFILTVEIATIYSKNGSVRKLHNLVVSPTFEAAEELNERLSKIGNLRADGRPILGMDSKELLKVSLDIDKDNLFIPAHVWTPWFGMFGSKSGFDSIEEAFEELSPKIRAIETGLSSDPFMNWRIKDIRERNVAIISNSDGHSPGKLGREATVINGEINYVSIIDAIKNNDERLTGTIEFFPQEGKYHYDGHRLCEVSLHPNETKKLNGICPNCDKPLTVGVDYRVNQLADKAEDFKPGSHKQVEYIIPLIEMIAEIKGKGSSSKSVIDEYHKIISSLGNEFNILRRLKTDEIKNHGFSDLATVIQRMRKGDVYIEPGYDGVYGIIKLFKNKSEREQQGDQMTLGI